MSARRFDPLVMFDIPKHGGGQAIAINGVDLFVDTVNGSDQRSGISWDAPLQTVGEAMSRLNSPRFYSLPGNRKGSNSRIFCIGDIREHVTAPLGVYGTKIIGAFGGRPRHSTSGGVALDGNSCSWRDTAVAGSAPLIQLREQGWELHNMLMVPPPTYGAVQLHREETATYPDASHFIMTGNRIIASGSAGLGIDDEGAGYNISVEDNVFENLEYAYKAGGVGIAAPGRYRFTDNDFSLNKHDIYANAYGWRILRNRFRTVYDASTHPNTVNLAATADSGNASQKTIVMENWFADAAANVTIAKGYKPATGDIWRNYVTDTAAFIVAVPA